MRESKCHQLLFTLVIFAMAMTIPSVANADWESKASGIKSSSYAYTWCPKGGPPCIDRKPWGWGSHTSTCNSSGNGCFAYAWATAYIPWRVNGGGTAEGGGEYLNQVGDSVAAEGIRESETVFRVRGSSYLTERANHELALVRYTGDWSIFDTLQFTSANDLLELGLIQEEDILLLLANDDIPSNFDFPVDVTGISDEEILLLGFGHGSSGVPTLTQWGLIILLVVLAGIATWVVLKRRRMVTA